MTDEMAFKITKVNMENIERLDRLAKAERTIKAPPKMPPHLQQDNPRRAKPGKRQTKQPGGHGK